MWGISASRATWWTLFLDVPSGTIAVQHFGVDIWMTTIASELPACPSASPSSGRPRCIGEGPLRPPARLFRQVIGTIFDLMIHYADFWRQVKWSKPTAALRHRQPRKSRRRCPPRVNVARLHERFLQGFDK